MSDALLGSPILLGQGQTLVCSESVQIAFEFRPGNFLTAARKLLVAGPHAKREIYSMKLHLMRMLWTGKPNSGTRSSGAQICARLKNGTIPDNGRDKMNKTSFVYGVVVAIAVFCLGTISAQSQNSYCVRAGATGSGNGSDWNNAFTSLPATLQRGATYYVAGGSYPSYTFNTAQSGTTVITVKKASPTDHGTNAGWVASYGTAQAVFASLFNVYRGYFVLDGQYRNENNWFDGDSYGFKIANNGEWQNLVIRDDKALVYVPNVTIKYLYIAAIVGQLPPAGQGYRPYAIDTETYSTTIRNVNYVFSRVYVDGSNNPFFVRTLTSPIVEYCASWRTCGDVANFHGEVINRYYSSSGGGIIRYNHIKDAYNGVSGFPEGGGTGCFGFAETSGAEVYGNIVENFYCGNGAVAAGWNNDNLKVYNNTFINGGANTPTVRFPAPESGNTGVGNEAYNNLTVGCVQVQYTGVGTFGYNSTESSSVFVNYAAGDYRLARRTTMVGTNLPSPYNVDMAGNTRGAGGVWDLGAYQYVSGASDTNPPTVTLTAPTNGMTASNVVSLIATASDNVGVVGVTFFVNGAQLANVTSGSYSYNWDSTTVTNGTYKIYAQARDAAGNIATSVTNTVTVNNTAGALPSPVAYWSFNEGTGTTAADAASTNTLTLRNGATWSGTGKFGAALSLDGVNDRADAPNSPGLDINGSAMSVAAWVNLQDQGTWQQLVAKVSSVGTFTSPYFSWHLFGGSVSSTQWLPQFQVVNSGGTSVNVSSSVAVNYGAWVHVVGVYDGSAVRIYVNGMEQGNAAQSGNVISFSQPLYIGASGLPDGFAKGLIDEVRVYSGALSAAQVLTLYNYNGGTSTLLPPTGFRVVSL